MSLIRDAEVENTIRAYAAPLLAAAGLGDGAVRLHIVNDRNINAFVAGGPNLFVSSGMLAVAEEPGEVIGVIAHEIGHIAGGHLVRTRGAIENASAEMILATLLGAGALIAGQGEVGTAIISGGQAMAQQSFLRYSRAQEQNADQAAVQLLERTGQSAAGLLRMFRRLQERERLALAASDPYMRTHPLTRDRVRFVRDRVEGEGPAAGSTPQALRHAHRRMVAKLRGFLDPPETTLRAYPADDESTIARYARAIAYYRIPDLERSLATLDTLLADHPDDPWFHELKGRFSSRTVGCATRSRLTAARWRCGAMPRCCALASPARRSRPAIPRSSHTRSSICRWRPAWSRTRPSTGTSSALPAAAQASARPPSSLSRRPPICAATWGGPCTTLPSRRTASRMAASAGSGRKTSAMPPRWP